MTLTPQDIQSIAAIVTQTQLRMRQDEVGPSEIGLPRPLRPGESPYIDYFVESARPFAIRDQLPHLIGCFDMRRAVRITYEVLTSLDQPIRIQVVGGFSYFKDMDVRHYEITQPNDERIIVPEGSCISIPVGLQEGAWHPWIGLRIQALSAPSEGTVSIVAHSQQWVIPGRRLENA